MVYVDLERTISLKPSTLFTQQRLNYHNMYTKSIQLQNLMTQLPFFLILVEQLANLFMSTSSVVHHIHVKVLALSFI
jgi:hypothetical protein